MPRNKTPTIDEVGIEKWVNQRKEDGLCEYGYDDLIFQMGLIRSRQNRADNFNVDTRTMKDWEDRIKRKERHDG